MSLKNVELYCSNLRTEPKKTNPKKTICDSRLFECVCSKTTFISSETVATGASDSPQDDLTAYQKNLADIE